MNAVVIVPARYASTRFPAKLLAELGGKPVIVRTLEQAAKARSVDRVLAAVDDDRLAAAVESAGFEVRHTRADHVSGTDRIAEAAADIEGEVVVNVQGDEPFMDPATIDALVSRMNAPDRPDMATACTPVRDAASLHDPSVVKVVRDQHACALYFSRSLIPFSRDREPEELLDSGLYFRHLGIYAYRRQFLMHWPSLPPHPLEEAEKLEQLRALAAGASIAVIETNQPAPGIDTPEDWAAAERFLSENPGELS